LSARVNAGIGLVLEFKLTDVVAFSTGLDVTNASFKASYTSDTATYIYKDDVVFESAVSADTVANKPGNYFDMNRLLDRKYKVSYLSIPLLLKMKTKDINGMTYFAQIGGNLFGRLQATADDNVEKTSFLNGKSNSTTNEVIEKIDITKSMNVLTACGNIGAGIEYNISGTTSLFASLNYQHHFMNATKADTGYLLRTKTIQNETLYSEFPNGTKLKQIVLSIGILF